MTSAVFRIVMLGVLLLGGCDLLTELASPDDAGNTKLCRDYVAHMNALEPCLGLRYDADNFCDGAENQRADLGPFYACLVANTSCNGGEPTMTIDGCAPPVAASRSTPQ
ncbi:MAG: hypothetical protein AAF211_19890 [Myxococcota bacterium]